MNRARYGGPEHGALEAALAPIANNLLATAAAR
jgi:hypothetical protein